LGDSPQIYALSHKTPPGRYTVTNHITQSDITFNETQEAINKTQPKYIVTLAEAPPLPFQIQSYTLKFILTNANIYERNF